MTENKRATETPSRRGSDLAKVDAHQIAAAEYDDIPEVTAADFARADLKVGGVTVRKGGRPKAENPKVPVNLRLDPDVIEHFKRSGPGWQSRMNAALRMAMEGTVAINRRATVVKRVKAAKAAVAKMREKGSVALPSTVPLAGTFERKPMQKTGKVKR